ncbi:MAG: TIGR04283 family arsenosugar biosynthesis glycosyltransferase [Nitrospirota bacterium]
MNLKKEYSFSVIIPVLNESSRINQTIEHVFKTSSLSGFDVEVIVVDGDPGGKTVNSIRSDSVIKIISRKGRGAQMNRGAAVAHGDVLLFVHSDTMLPEDALRAISSVMKEKTQVGGAFDLGIESDKLIFRIIEIGVYLRTRLTRIPYGDQAIFIRKDFFRMIQGYREIPLMEDFELMRRIKKLGYRISIIPQKVRTSPRRWEKKGVLYCTFTNWALRSLYLCGVHPEKLLKFYYKNW